MEARPPIKIHILHCGTVSVSPSVPEGGLSLGGALGGVFCPESRRVTLPVSCYLIEHPAGRVLVDTGISRVADVRFTCVIAAVGISRNAPPPDELSCKVSVSSPVRAVAVLVPTARFDVNHA